MEIRDATRRLIAEIEQQTGYSVVITQDATLTALSGVSMAGPQRPSHLVRIHPNAPAGTDYYAVYYCRMIQRLYENPPEKRLIIGYGEKGRYRVRKLIQRTAIGKRLDAAALEGVCERLIGGLLTHLRSVPVGLRIDDWILRDHPELTEMQTRAVQAQLQDNNRSAGENVRSMVPGEVFAATMAVNAAFAQFWAEKWNQPELALPYKAAGHITAGVALLGFLRDIPDSGKTDRALIDAWAAALNVADWYVWVPYQNP